MDYVRRATFLAVLLVLAASCDRTDTGPAASPQRSPAGTATTPAATGAAGLPLGTLRIDTGDGVVAWEVEIAETAEAREVGLMGRTDLARDRGMVFLFEGPTTGSFWMKDTLIPLQIAFWDEDGRIVSILSMEPCEEDPCPLYSPGASYVGALEVNAGALSEAGVEEEDRVALER